MKTKADYKLALRIVGAAINEWDPYSLLASGCPQDEFESEIVAIVAQIPRIKSAQDTALVISRVFSSAFERAGFAPDDCAAVGSKLFGALSTNGLVGQRKD